MGRRRNQRGGCCRCPILYAWACRSAQAVAMYDFHPLTISHLMCPHLSYHPVQMQGGISWRHGEINKSKQPSQKGDSSKCPHASTCSLVSMDWFLRGSLVGSSPVAHTGNPLITAWGSLQHVLLTFLLSSPRFLQFLTWASWELPHKLLVHK